MKYAEIDITGVALTTERLILRPFCESDLNDFYEYARVEGVGEAAGWNHHGSIEETKQILDRFIAHRRTFAVTDRASGKVIGSLGLEIPSPVYERKIRRRKFTEIGYVLSKDYWGRGLMCEAVNAVLDYFFTVKGYPSVGCAHFKDNARSRRVIEKCGFEEFACTSWLLRSLRGIRI